MKKIAVVGIIWLFIGCQNSVEGPGNSPGLKVSLDKCQTTTAAKIQLDRKFEAQKLFQSQDSIHFVLDSFLHCDSQLSFSVTIISPDTLSFRAKDVGDSRTKCICNKKITAEYKARAGENLSKIKIVNFSEIGYHLTEN